MRKVRDTETLKEYCKKCIVDYHFNADAACTIDLPDDELEKFVNSITDCRFIKDKDEIESEILRCDMDFKAAEDYCFISASDTIQFVIAVPKDAVDIMMK